MKRNIRVLPLGILTGLINLIAISFVQLLYYIPSTGGAFTLITIPFYSQILIYGMCLASFSFFVQSILGAWLLIFLARFAQFKWMGVIAGAVTGILVDLTYFLLSMILYSGLRFPFDYILVMIPILVFSAVGIYVFNNEVQKNSPASGKTDAPLPVAMRTAQPDPAPIKTPPAPPLPDQQDSRKIKPHPAMALTLLIPLFLGLCLCALFLVVYGSTKLMAPTLADKYWTYRITQKLQEKGLSAQRVEITRDKTQNILSHLDIEVGIDRSQDYMEYQDVIEAVHKCVFDALPTPVFQPEGLGEIDVFINDESIGNYRISIDYEIAHQYELGKISGDDYIQHWRFN